ncbi:MAG: hypothetical protein US54_C0046G0003 [Candidatus Roizmanbacteria bacterium GW2011_GWA2_37_7]|uniref:HypC/HybG/HupF family hydrogenase formation chaperone n=1 Tax=Candidatus Roizmanbacteria bacterium GW2011_GWA2_37_7 TaxID=1618481 RepID=A0A0G0HEQ2_9BACT|nr:MAG: hypothetical protein US54_C0046G0003 [Candidatus Roizmanbacteria bacterium GW2011_GWA2_37_7]
MCFAIPKKIKTVLKDTILTTDGVTAKKGGLTLQPGQYVMIFGNMVVEKIPEKQAAQAISHIGSSTFRS